VDRYVYLRHPASLDHDTGAHPERAARIEAIEQRLAGCDWAGFRPEAAPVAQREAIEAVHPSAYIDSIATLAERGGGMLDSDTIASSGSYEAALRAAGAAVRSVDLLLGGDAAVTFCGLRPPGHHAEPDHAMGFCLFNNVAIGAAHAIREHGIERVLVLDWDVHHGNGTNDIFYGSDAVLYASLHQWPLYPGTGALTDSGAGSGEGYTVNLPMPPGSSGQEWLGAVEQIVAPIAAAYEPQLVLVSAGFDAHRDDPLADCILDTEAYGQLAAAMRSLADGLGAPLGLLLEGGYDLDALAASVEATLRGVRTTGASVAEQEISEPVAAARDHHARHWPVLAA
jgi:acetoin utilization deacetylase AcuC-like enzyme